jgi:hypothetical protein
VGACGRTIQAGGPRTVGLGSNTKGPGATVPVLALNREFVCPQESGNLEESILTTPAERAGDVCDRLDKALRSAEMSLSTTANLLACVIRDEAWRERRIRTGAIVRCESFLDLLTSPPLRGYGEDPKRVEALLKDDSEALRMFREATTAPLGTNQYSAAKEGNDNVITHSRPVQGNSRAYRLDQLKRKAPALYERVLNKELSENRAAIEAGLQKRVTALDQLNRAWRRASAAERDVFRAQIGARDDRAATGVDLCREIETPDDDRSRRA